MEPTEAGHWAQCHRARQRVATRSGGEHRQLGSREHGSSPEHGSRATGPASSESLFSLCGAWGEALTPSSLNFLIC